VWLFFGGVLFRSVFFFFFSEDIQQFIEQ